jgi:transcriptional regulator with XRE-family HTH domain
MVKIYKIFYENNPNVVYIGKTEKSLERRFSQHIYNSKKNKKTKLYNWVSKYGYNDLKISLICEVEIDKGDFAEIEEIRLHKERGFILKNQTNGGDGVRKGYKHTQEVCIKVSERNLLSGIFKGEKNFFFGKTGKKNHKSIETHQYSLNGAYIKSFESQNLITKELGLPWCNRPISKACKTGGVAYGYLWSSIKYDKLEPKRYKRKNMSESDILSAFEMYQNGANFSEIEKRIGFSRHQLTRILKKNFNIDNKYKSKVYMSESDILSAFEMYQNGLTIKEIEKKTGFSGSQIRRKLKNKYNVQFEHFILDESVIVKAAKHYEEGISFNKIYKELNKDVRVSRERLTKKIKEYLKTKANETNQDTRICFQ